MLKPLEKHTERYLIMLEFCILSDPAIPLGVCPVCSYSCKNVHDNTAYNDERLDICIYLTIGNELQKV